MKGKMLMKATHLSKRLNRVAEYVSSFGSSPRRLLDIGSDHAYLPVYLTLNKLIDYAVAGEIAQGPYQSALSQVSSRDLSSKIEVRLGDGFQVMRDEDNINIVTICGMGGGLIQTILGEGYQRLQPNHLLILQANTGQTGLRSWLKGHAYDIIAEDLIEDHQHIYEIIVAHDRFNQDGLQDLTAKDLLIGPYNGQNKSPIFKKYWQGQLNSRQRVIHSMKEAKQKNQSKIAAIQEEIRLIREVLEDETS